MTAAKLVLFDLECERAVCFFSRSVRIKKLEIDRSPPPLSPELSLVVDIYLLKKKIDLQVSWDWSCESTVIYRAVSYLDTYMASVGVAELGKYQVRGGEREVKNCIWTSREQRERDIFFRFQLALSILL